MHLLFGYSRIHEWIWDDFCAQKMEWMLSHTTSSMHLILSVMQNKHYCDQPHENTISTHACFTLKITTTQERHERRAGGTRQYLTFQTACLWQEMHANERRWERHVWSALTSLEEKVNVWERPDRLGSTTSPEKSEAGLLGFESSSTDKLWNGHKEQDLLSEHKDWGSFSSLNQKNELQRKELVSECNIINSPSKWLLEVSDRYTDQID